MVYKSGYCSVLSALCDQFTDRIAHGREFGFIFCHNIALVHRTIIMEIVRKLIQNEQFGSFQFFDRKVKERSVVCLEFYGSVCGQDFVIQLEEFVRCQSSSCMTGLWPWIGEVQVDTGYFRRGEYRWQVVRIHADEADVGRSFSRGFQFLEFFNGT